jgi:hypothetical protein
MAASIEVPRYHKVRGTLRLMRALGLWRLYDNTLLPWVNHRYRRAHQRARAAMPEPVALPEASAPALQKLRQDGLCHLPKAFPREQAVDLSQRFGALIEAGSPQVHVHHQGAYALRQPLDQLGEACLALFDGPTGLFLQAHYGSHFRLEWLDCYRTSADAARKSSWLWHVDNVPTGCLKVMLLLTDSTRDRGAMRYFPRSVTRKLRKAGYPALRHRKLDLSEYAERAGIELEPLYVEAPAGDVLVFDPNILHCGEPPKQAFRDVMTFFVLPSIRPWREAYEARGGAARVHSDPGGFPPAPEM